MGQDCCAPAPERKLYRYDETPAIESINDNTIAVSAPLSQETPLPEEP